MSHWRDWDYKKDVIEDTPRITKKQYDYLEILRNGMGMSLATRNRHIMDILHLPSPAAAQQFDVWAISKAQASTVIQQLVDWKENKERT